MRADASADEIRLAYRALARELHPDRVPGGAGGGGRSMTTVNEAYRVLSDPGRRVVYDRTLAPGADSAAPASQAASAAPRAEPETLHRHSVLSPSGPARVPWKLMGVVAIIGSLVVLVSSFFDEPPATQAPDGILLLGSCIAFEPNGDAREVACSGTSADIVVDRMVPLDGTCPFGTAAHRDRLGMVIVCISQ